MPFSRALPLILAVGMLAGCAHHKPPRMAVPNGQALLPSLRARYQEIYPGSHLGLVIAADPSARLVAVGDVNPKDFRINQIVTFIDPLENVLTTGTIVRILPDSIHVKYAPPPPGHRAPVPGDIMVRFKQPF